VHLKSGCFEDQRASACQQLFAQVPVVAGWMADRTGPAIVGGDLNRRLELPDDQLWQQINASAGPLHIAGMGIGPTCFPRFTTFIDFFVLNDAARGMKPTGAFQEITFSQGPPASDHCPIVIELAP
jgi:endonuclease/exonuclease/phosphatase family metal-dependent hydrolase